MLVVEHTDGHESSRDDGLVHQGEEQENRQAEEDDRQSPSCDLFSLGWPRIFGMLHDGRGLWIHRWSLWKCWIGMKCEAAEVLA